MRGGGLDDSDSDRAAFADFQEQFAGGRRELFALDGVAVDADGALLEEAAGLGVRLHQLGGAEQRRQADAAILQGDADLVQRRDVDVALLKLLPK